MGSLYFITSTCESSVVSKLKVFFKKKWVWRPKNGTLWVKTSLKKKKQENVTRKTDGKRTNKESFLGNQRKREDMEPRKISSGRSYRKIREGKSRTGAILFTN